MLRKILESIETSRKVPFIADRGYDAVVYYLFHITKI
jgi:hypothetical protein